MRAGLFAGLAAAALVGSTASAATPVEWPSYNRTLNSDRYAPLSQINRDTVKGLKVLCTYDLGAPLGFQSGLVETGGAIYATTDQDIISIDPNTCRQNWRVHETYAPSQLGAARGVAVEGGKVFRGSPDGKVRAYDVATGKRLWATEISEFAAGETIPAAPFAWRGRVFIGQAGGDRKGVKGRMYALDANTGAILWETYLVPKDAGDRTRGPSAPLPEALLRATWKNTSEFPITGGGTWTSYSLDTNTGLLYIPGGNPAPDFAKAYRGGDNLFTGSVVALDALTGAYANHVSLVAPDDHDWDVASAPVLYTDKAGRQRMAATPKDGVLYGTGRTGGKVYFRTPVTTRLNANTALTAAGVRFCPGTKGGSEWNGPGYDPTSGLLVVGQVDWCSRVRLDPKDMVKDVPMANAWSGSSQDGFGKLDPVSDWAGWVSAVDGATGKTRWKYKTATPVVGGVTPTAGGLTLVGEVGGTLYAFDTAKGTKLWSQDLGAPVGGGVISYDTGLGQRVAVAAGPVSPIWPTPKVNARIVILGLQ